MNTWKQDTPSAMAVTITPEIAAAMLATSSGNRAMRERYVDRLAEAMLRGEWRITNQGIGFDTTGALRDGHHRLSACIRAGVPIRSMLVLGMPNTAYQVIDTGALRSYADRMDLPQTLAEVITFAAAIMHYGLDTKPVTVQQILPILGTPLFPLLQELTQTCNKRRVYVTATPMRLAACVAVMHGQEKGWVWQQYEALALMNFEKMTPMSQALVRQIQNGSMFKASNKKWGSSTRYDQLARGLRVFDEGSAHIGRLVIAPGGVESAVQSVRETLRNAVAETTQQPSLPL